MLTSGQLVQPFAKLLSMMTLTALDRRSLPDRVFEQITAEIVTGSYPVGAAIPSERELSEALQVNRHVVREAVKRLEQVGLVRVSQGGRTTVLDYRRNAGLDLLAIVAEHVEPVEGLTPLLTSALEMRAGIAIDLARLCAERGDRARGAKLLEIAGQLAETSDGEELLELDERFWQTIVDGAGNLAYQLAFNSLIRAVHARRELSLPVLERELKRGAHRLPIAEAIAAGDADAAAEAARAGLITVLPRARATDGRGRT
jgi:GntR family transcriptional regulator, transcriptional repressor for pyruvate dehydrogenase complex